jgi:DNA-binding transcriptional ArsR family regulator
VTTAASARVDRVFHAVGDSTRRRMIERLSRGPATVTELARPLDISLAAATQHLHVLKRSGLVRTQKTGRVRTCQLDTTGLGVATDWLTACRAEWERRLDRLGELLDVESR